ncbi:MAG: 23S rRNA (guanosine(2251)-2'-O)-methyltransferase RlmB [Ignavibacteriales bacterium]|nr:23S rRNA (guanosine(2251)-2'-O)-methyltransferase RlmB [Ignavibacteriales bacterium]
MNLITGRKPVLEALRSNTPIEKVMISSNAHGDIIDDIVKLLRQKNIPYKFSPADQIAKTARDQNTQGMIAFVGSKEFSDITELLDVAKAKNEKPFFLIFDEIEDVHNLGALIRTAVCVGAHGGIVPKHHNAPVNETVVKTSAGASLQFPMARVTNVAQTIDELKENGIWIVGTEMNAEKNFTEVDYTVPVAIVIGNEGKGMRRLVKEKCDFLVKIPMKGSFDSLNASVAGALVMYEVLRKRST